jgi:hypothetical protein
MIDADDYCQDNDGGGILEEIHDKNPNFRILLFTIVGRCSPYWIEQKKKIDWIRLAPHGWFHETSRECENWTYEQSKEYLEKIEPLGLEKIFKAPGWQISDGMYQALLEKGYTVADQHYNDYRRPKNLPVIYAPLHHYHIGHLGGHNPNEISLFKETLYRI